MKSESSTRVRSLEFLLIMIFALACVWLLRKPFFAMPIFSDPLGWLNTAYLMMNFPGTNYYLGVADQKPPLIVYSYILFIKLFTNYELALHVLDATCLWLSGVGFYLLLRMRFSPLVSFLTIPVLFMAAVGDVNYFTPGFSERLALPWQIFGMYCILRADEKDASPNWSFLGGSLLAVSLLFLNSCAIFIALLTLVLAFRWRPRRIQSTGAFIVKFIPYALGGGGVGLAFLFWLFYNADFSFAGFMDEWQQLVLFNKYYSQQGIPAMSFFYSTRMRFGFSVMAGTMVLAWVGSYFMAMKKDWRLIDTVVIIHGVFAISVLFTSVERDYTHYLVPWCVIIAYLAAFAMAGFFEALKWPSLTRRVLALVVFTFCAFHLRLSYREYVNLLANKRIKIEKAKSVHTNDDETSLVRAHSRPGDYVYYEYPGFHFLSGVRQPTRHLNQQFLSFNWPYRAREIDNWFKDIKRDRPRLIVERDRHFGYLGHRRQEFLAWLEDNYLPIKEGSEVKIWKAKDSATTF